MRNEGHRGRGGIRFVDEFVVDHRKSEIIIKFSSPNHKRVIRLDHPTKWYPPFLLGELTTGPLVSQLVSTLFSSVPFIPPLANPLRLRLRPSSRLLLHLFALTFLVATT